MFKSIYKYELKYWLKQPSTYIYALVVFGFAFVTMTGMASEPPKRFNTSIVNSPTMVYSMTKRFVIVIFLILPAIIGLSVFRDFSSKMYNILYAYPFGKMQYLGAKFLSAFTILLGIASMLGFGYALGAAMPWVTTEHVQAFNPMTYLHLYGAILIPDLLLISVVVFGIVLLSRNIYAGFIMILVMVLVPQITGFIFNDADNTYWRALLDPFGFKALTYYTGEWTLVERNEWALPFKGVLLWNRVLWLSVAVGLFALIARTFEFHQNAFTFFTKKSEAVKNPIRQLGNITKVNLPKVSYDFSFVQRLKTMWKLSNIDFRYILTSKVFLCLVLSGFIFVMMVMATVNPRGDTETLPMTWKILELPSTFYAGVINLITFLYAGLLVHRERMAKMNQLVDTNPVPNWVLLGSKFIALIKMQMVLLFIVMIGGIISQAIKGFYDFEIGQYVFNLYGINLIHYVIYAMLALFIQTLFKNPYLGFFVLLFAPVGFIGLAEFGPKNLGLNFLEQMMFRFNQAPGDVFGLRYSDMDGYGPMLPAYFLYKTYWALGGLLLLGGALMLWTRGLPHSFKERLSIARQRFGGQLAMGFGVIIFAFLSMGFAFYYDANISNEYFTRHQKNDLLAKAMKKYKVYDYFNQPKIQAVKIDMNIFPEERQFKTNGSYKVHNQSDKAIDTLILTYMGGLNMTYDFDRPTTIISEENIANLCHLDMLKLTEALMPGDSMVMTFANENAPTTLLQSNDFVKEHGTYIEDDVFPRFGNWLSFFKKEHNMGGHENHPHPTDCKAHAHSFMAKDADRVDFETVVSTSKDQLAIAPGHLQKEWEQDNRRYFHYKMDRKIAMSYLFMSGRYAVARDKWKDIDLEIYYDEDHPYNIDRMMEGLKDGLAYGSENFSPYQFKQVRMIEFSQTGRATAHGFPGSIPIGEGAGFIADVVDGEEGGIDYAYGTAVHEIAHMWWGHQVLPANVRGSKMVVESLAEYVNVMVRGHQKGVEKLRKYQEGNMKFYLQSRSRDSRTESPLMYAYHDQNYIHYPKGALVFYAMSDYIGEKNLNNAIKAYVEKVAFQEKTYTTSIEMVDYISKAVPDSLQYLIKDMFETVTLYDNQMVNWESTLLENGQYQVDMEFRTRKYRSGEAGKPVFTDGEEEPITYINEKMEKRVYSLPLADYLDIGIFDADGKEIYLQKHKVTNIQNKLSIIVDEVPSEVGVDPYLKLIDRIMDDNRK